MQQYNVFQAIFLSFYSKKLYRDVATNWGGKSFAYLFLLVAIVSIFFVLTAQKVITHGYHELYAKVSPQLPVVTISDGKVSTPEQRPYIITDPDTHENIAVIDTTGQYKTIKEANASVLVTETEIMTHPKKDEVRVYQIPSSFSQVINPEKINTIIEKIISFLWVIIYIFAVLLHYIYRIIQALFYSIIGKIFSSIVGARLTYWQIVQIMMVAITPVIVIGTIQGFFGAHINHEGFLYFALAMLYLFYGILANKNVGVVKDGV